MVAAYPPAYSGRLIFVLSSFTFKVKLAIYNCLTSRESRYRLHNWLKRLFIRVCLTVKVTQTIHNSSWCMAAISQMLLTSCLDKCQPPAVFPFSPHWFMLLFTMARRTACTLGSVSWSVHSKFDQLWRPHVVYCALTRQWQNRLHVLLHKVLY